MFNSVFLKTLYDMRKSMLSWAIIFILMSLMMVSLYPSITESGIDFDEYLDSMPDAFKGMFGSEMDMSTLNGYLSVELFSAFFPFMMLAFAVVYGAGLVANEEDSGSLDVLLSTPLPRWRVMIEKHLAMAVFIVVQNVACFVGIAGGAVLIGVDELNTGTLIEGLISLALLTLFFGSLALGITGLRGARGSAMGVTLGVAAITYLVNALSEMSDMPDFLVKLSPWYYYNGVYVLRDGLDAANMAVLIVCAALFVIAGVMSFQRRDLGT